MPPRVTRMAVLKSCERLLSSRRVKMATMPAIVSMIMKSSGCCRALAAMSTVVAWAMNAVRESMKTRTKMGTMANGRI